MRTPVRLSRRITITAVTVAAAGTAAAVGLAGFADATTSAGHQRHQGSPVHPATCSAATLRGTYLFQGNGWTVAGGTAKPVAFAGAEHFDGAGHIQGNSTDSVNGAITRNPAYTGTYRLAADCIGTFTIGAALHFDLYTTPDGNAFTYVETDPGSVSAAGEQQAARG